MVVAERAIVAQQVDLTDPDISAAVALEGRLGPLRDALGLAELTGGELSLFAMVAHRMRLDPFAKQIYAIKRKGKVTFQVGIDGFRATAEDTGEYRGSDEPEFGPIIDKPFPHPEWARVVVHRQYPDGEWLHQSATVWWDEFYPEDGQNFQWRKMPRNQLAKCAEAAGFRKAFPRTFGQVYEPAEMDQAAEARPVGDTPPTARERAAARRASVEAPHGETTNTQAVVSPPDEAVPAQGSPSAAAIGAVEPEGASDVPSGAPSDIVEGEVREEPSQCESTSDPAMPPVERCRREAGHSGAHKTASTSWPA